MENEEKCGISFDYELEVDEPTDADSYFSFNEETLELTLSASSKQTKRNFVLKLKATLTNN